MHTEDYFWKLFAKHLANEATDPELRELNELLRKYPDADKWAKVIAYWWDEESQEDIVRRGELLFEKIKEKIKAEQEK
mgnify:CR=1 FL=1